MLTRRPSRRRFLAASMGVWTASPGVSAAPAPTVEVSPEAVTGPMVGHVAHDQAILWIRPPRTGMVRLTIWPESGGAEFTAAAKAEPAHDLCVTLAVKGLAPATAYAYRIVDSNEAELGRGVFRTWPAPDATSCVTLALGSCAYTEPSPVWTRMEAAGCSGLILLGDTPYIDNYDLVTARRRHREFLHIPELRPLIAKWPTWGTWDDHDFGLNAHLGDSDPAGKARTRQAFMEYRALASHGGPDGGVYTRFRTGPLETWLLDPRWFSNTGPSPVAADKPTCFGATQWTWLQRTLRESTAPFKLLAMGEIWQDKTNAEPDDLGTFPHEREALFDFVRRERIGGVVLCGGDIHCSRHLVTKGRVGYDLHSLVTSPLHASTIPSLNVPHPDLVWGRAEPRTFLRLRADTTTTPGRLTATFLRADGHVLHELELTDDDLAPH